MILANSTWEEVSKYVDDTVVAVLPVGSNEQHGLHLPVNNDIFCAQELAARAVERVRDSVKTILLPSLPYGISQHHMAFAGTITLTAEVFTNVVKDIARSLVKHGIKKIVIVNGHGGNVAAINTAIQELHQETGATILLVNWWDLGADLIRDHFGFVFHACETETSIAAALGQRVLMERARGFKPESPSTFVKYNLIAGAPRIQASIPAMEVLSKTGSVGDPTKADPKKGGAIVSEVVDRMVILLKELSRSE